MQLFYPPRPGDQTRRQLVHATTPRHLAGPGDPRYVTAHLLAAGWSDVSVPGYPHVVLASPAGDVRVALESQSPIRSAGWRIHSTCRRWSMALDAHVPVEIVAGVTDLLAVPGDLSEPDRSVWEVLEQRGWSIARDLPDSRMMRPATDPSLLVDYSDGLGRWTIEAVGGYTTNRLIWRASLTHDVPAALLHGLLTRLTDSAPLYRGRYLTSHHPLLVQDDTSLDAADLVTAYEHRLAAARDAAGRACHPAGTTPAPADHSVRTGPRRIR
ncbi:DUF317 domain-containing protein [Streptomyces sp. NPDC050095]|uniref:DUF317 domain-containing protein n=1 Tax=unclassified Streptomyces TaxID=2593676 RepID=UPI00343BC771